MSEIELQDAILRRLFDRAKLASALWQSCCEAQDLSDAFKVKSTVQHRIAQIVGIDIRLLRAMFLGVRRPDRADKIVGRFHHVCHAQKVARA